MNTNKINISSKSSTLKNSILDNYFLTQLPHFALTDEWVRGYLSSRDSTLFVQIMQIWLNKYPSVFISGIYVRVKLNFWTKINHLLVMYRRDQRWIWHLFA